MPDRQRYLKDELLENLIISVDAADGANDSGLSSPEPDSNHSSDSPNPIDELIALERSLKVPESSKFARSIDLEISNYLSLHPVSSIENWWFSNKSNFANLYRLFKRVCCTQPSEVSCERLFSQTSLIATKLRCNLQNSKLQKIIFIKQNQICE